MKFSTTTTLILTFSIALVTAQSCTSDVALAWPWTPETDASESTYNSDTTYETLEARGQCNAQNLIDDTRDCVEETSKGMGAKKLKRQTADLQCESNETCFLYVDDWLLCMDETSGDYHDDFGGSGNAFSGAYTASDGDVQTATGEPAEFTADATTVLNRSSGSSPATMTAYSSSQSSAAARETGNVAPALGFGPAVAAMAAVPMVAFVL